MGGACLGWPGPTAHPLRRAPCAPPAPGGPALSPPRPAEQAPEAETGSTAPNSQQAAPGRPSLAPRVTGPSCVTPDSRKRGRFKNAEKPTVPRRVLLCRGPCVCLVRSERACITPPHRAPRGPLHREETEAQRTSRPCPCLFPPERLTGTRGGLGGDRPCPLCLLRTSSHRVHVAGLPPGSCHPVKVPSRRAHRTWAAGPPPCRSLAGDVWPEQPLRPWEAPGTKGR